MIMKLLFELSKEHTDLPRDEIKSCLNSLKIKYNVVESNENIFIIKSDIKSNQIKELANRLSFTFFIDELLFFCSNSETEIKKNASQNEIKKEGSIAINYKNRSDDIKSQPILKSLGEIYTKNRTVDLKNPDVIVRVIITEKNVYVGLKIEQVDRTLFEKRKVQFRPFFSPISLHPKLARALVNLSSVKKGDILLDPFCGTGGILLEAGLIKAKIIGSDIEEKMIEGCKNTLDFYKIKNYRLYCSDIGDISNFIKSVDGVVTDLPYGKSTTTKGENIKNLYTRAFENIAKLLKKDCLAVIGLSDFKIIKYGERSLTLVKTYVFKVHKSMNRYFVVYKK